MRFHKGCMVEVFSKKKDPSGVWRCAQIVEDNGDGYTVRYYRCPNIAKEGVDKVPSEVVRPRPPPVTGSTVWAVGDVVEVLDDGYWRVCMIEEIVEDDEYYGIHVIGSVDEFRVRKSGIRARQVWKDAQWFPLGMDSGIDEKLIFRMRKRAHMQIKGVLTNVEEVQESVLLSKTLKRSFVDLLSTDKASLECGMKRRAVAKEAERYDVPDSYSFNGKVNTYGNLRKTQCEDKVKISKETTNINDTSYRNREDAHPLGRTSQHDCVSTRSSVASCSIDDTCLERLVRHSPVCSSQDAEYLSDADSFDHKGDDEVMSFGRLKQEDALRLHEEELYRYRSALEELYACGPLSWELEMHLTNLRQKYSVSTDEHLMELRRLKSS